MRGSHHPVPFDAKRAAAISASIAVGAFIPADVKAGFNPAQSRSATGQWSAQAGGPQQPKKKPKPKPRSRSAAPQRRAPKRRPWGQAPGTRTPVSGLGSTPAQAAPPLGLVALALGANLHISDMGSARVKEYLRELEKMPVLVAQRITVAGVQIYLGDRPLTQLDDLQHLSGEHPRGWPADETWDDVIACAAPGLVVAGSGEGGSTGDVLLHEIGHSLGDSPPTPESQIPLQDDPEWIAIHRAVYSQLDPYLQQDGPGGEAGRQEFFAEVFSTTVTDERQARALYGNAAVNWVKRKLQF